MAQKKAHEVDAWLARPETAHPIVLIYGPDRGLVSERAALLVKHAGFDTDDPFSVTRLDAAELESDPGRLIDEVNTVPMFANRRLIWVKGAGAHKALGAAVKDLCAAPPPAVILLIEGGDMKKGAPLRTAVENGSAGMALPCYVDQGRAIEGIIDEMLGRDGLAITPDARQLLKTSLGGDRLASRGEVEKLALYAHGRERVEAADITDIIGDVSARSIDDAIDALLAGDIAGLDRAFSGWVSGGNAPYLVLAAAMRQFQQLQQLRVQVDTGTSPGMAVNSARPPVFFSRRNTIERAVQLWTAQAIDRALARLQSTVLTSRTRAQLELATVRQALMALAVEASRLR